MKLQKCFTGVVMMTYLLDTHMALWLLNEDYRLSGKAKEIIVNPDNEFYFSVISMWEVAIKHMTKPDEMKQGGKEFLEYCLAAGFKKLPLDAKHVLGLEKLQCSDNAARHKDPFDRILLSQAKSEGMVLLTHDAKFNHWKEKFYEIV